MIKFKFDSVIIQEKISQKGNKYKLAYLSDGHNRITQFCAPSAQVVEILGECEVTFDVVNTNGRFEVVVLGAQGV